jgi:hypothetical protein
MDPNATPMLKRVARRAFILFNFGTCITLIIYFKNLLLGVLLSHITSDDNLMKILNSFCEN